MNKQEIKQTTSEMKEKYGTYVVVGILIFALVVSVAMNLYKSNTIETQADSIVTISEKAEDLSLELQNAVADDNKLSSYEESRKLEIDAIETLDGEIDFYEAEIKTAQEAKRMRENMKSDLEKQIRCQRAVVSKLEEGNCDVEETYNKYSL